MGQELKMMQLLVEMITNRSYHLWSKPGAQNQLRRIRVNRGETIDMMGNPITFAHNALTSTLELNHPQSNLTRGKVLYRIKDSYLYRTAMVATCKSPEMMQKSEVLDHYNGVLCGGSISAAA
ncbi:hypothetical protein HAX54_015676, partial [Datura stramonium]|nr:hypothetical protein [Datura stramonium]